MTAEATPISLTRNSWELQKLFDASRDASPTPERLRIADDSGRGTLEFVEISPSFNMIISEIRWVQDGELRYKGEGWVRLNCCLEADAAMDFAEMGRHELQGAECRFFHQPEGMECRHEIRGSRDSVCVTLSVKRDYLSEVLELDPDQIPATAGRVLSGRSDTFFFDRYPMRPEMRRSVVDMVRCDLTGRPRVLYQAAKAQELVCQTWDLASEPRVARAPLSVKLTAPQLRRVQEARDILDRALGETPPLRVLAREVGLNRNQLSAGFRELYQSSVYDYHLGQRMVWAWRALENDEMSVGEVAEKAGYNHQTSFATAFRNHFGVSPLEVRLGARRGTKKVPRS